ncbi:MAG: hypothetical protein IJ588_05630 [Prevotella sp.]|nr:hypothetical protein [Prevotella sp.]
MEKQQSPQQSSETGMNTVRYDSSSSVLLINILCSIALLGSVVALPYVKFYDASMSLYDLMKMVNQPVLNLYVQGLIILSFANIAVLPFRNDYKTISVLLICYALMGLGYAAYSLDGQFFETIKYWGFGVYVTLMATFGLFIGVIATLGKNYYVPKYSLTLGASLEIIGTAIVLLGLIMSWGYLGISNTTSFDKTIHTLFSSVSCIVFEKDSSLVSSKFPNENAFPQITFLIIISISIVNMFVKVYRHTSELTIIILVYSIFGFLGYALSEGKSSPDILGLFGRYLDIFAICFLLAGAIFSYRDRKSEKGKSKAGLVMKEYDYKQKLAFASITLFVTYFVLYILFYGIYPVRSMSLLVYPLCALYTTATFAYVIYVVSIMRKQVGGISPSRILLIWAILFFILQMHSFYGFYGFYSSVEWYDRTQTFYLRYTISGLSSLSFLLIPMAIRNVKLRVAAFCFIVLSIISGNLIHLLRQDEMVTVSIIAILCALIATAFFLFLAQGYKKETDLDDIDILKQARLTTSQLLTGIVSFICLLQIFHSVYCVVTNSVYEIRGFYFYDTSSSIIEGIINCIGDIALIAIPLCINKQKQRTVAFALILPIVIWSLCYDISQI